MDKVKVIRKKVLVSWLGVSKKTVLNRIQESRLNMGDGYYTRKYVYYREFRKIADAFGIDEEVIDKFLECSE